MSVFLTDFNQDVSLRWGSPPSLTRLSQRRHALENTTMTLLNSQHFMAQGVEGAFYKMHQVTERCTLKPVLALYIGLGIGGIIKGKRGAGQIKEGGTYVTIAGHHSHSTLQSIRLKV